MLNQVNIVMKIRNPPFDKLVDTNCGPTIVESQRDVSGFLPTAGEETAFFSEHPVPPNQLWSDCTISNQSLEVHIVRTLLLVFKSICLFFVSLETLLHG